jgi:hypothetical protein
MNSLTNLLTSVYRLPQRCSYYGFVYEAGFLIAKVAVLGETMKETPCITYFNRMPAFMSSVSFHRV